MTITAQIAMTIAAAPPMMGAVSESDEHDGGSEPESVTHSKK